MTWRDEVRTAEADSPPLLGIMPAADLSLN
jgi:hypothetical protein